MHCYYYLRTFRSIPTILSTLTCFLPTWLYISDCVSLETSVLLVVILLTSFATRCLLTSHLFNHALFQAQSANSPAMLFLVVLASNSEYPLQSPCAYCTFSAIYLSGLKSRLVVFLWLSLTGQSACTALRALKSPNLCRPRLVHQTTHSNPLLFILFFISRN